MDLPNKKYAQEQITIESLGTVVLYGLFNPSNPYTMTRYDKEGNVINELVSSSPHRNIFLIDDAGNLVWRVADYDFGDTFDKFVTVHVDKCNGKTIGQTFNGHIFEIDLQDGSLEKIGWTK